jgi:hypothetical protein
MVQGYSRASAGSPSAGNARAQCASEATCCLREGAADVSEPLHEGRRGCRRKPPRRRLDIYPANGLPAAQERTHVTPPPDVARAMLTASGRPIHLPLARANTPRALSISTTPIKSHHCLPVNWVNSASTTNGGVRFGEQRRVNSGERQGLELLDFMERQCLDWRVQRELLEFVEALRGAAGALALVEMTTRDF